MERECLSQHPSGALLRVRATPNAARSAATGITSDNEGGERLAVRIKAPPVDGKANEAVRKWAAKAFGLQAGRVSIVRGERSREKELLLEGLGLAEAKEILKTLLQVQEAETGKK